MERTEPQDCNFDGGYNTLICQEDLKDEEHLPYRQSNGQQVKGQ